MDDFQRDIYMQYKLNAMPVIDPRCFIMPDISCDPPRPLLNQLPPRWRMSRGRYIKLGAAELDRRYKKHGLSERPLAEAYSVLNHVDATLEWHDTLNDIGGEG